MLVKIKSPIGNISTELPEEEVVKLLHHALSVAHPIPHECKCGGKCHSKKEVDEKKQYGTRKEVLHDKPSNSPIDVDGGERMNSGFLLVECEHCGERKAFSSKIPLYNYTCSHCQEVTRLTDMYMVYPSCECGRRYHYRTNIQADVFEFTCMNCENLMDMFYNKKRGYFQN